MPPRNVNADLLDDEPATSVADDADEDLELDASANDPDPEDEADDAEGEPSDDEAELESEESDDGEGSDADEPEPPVRTRGQRHYADLRRKNREIAQRAADAERRATELAQQLASTQQPRSQMETPEVRRARLAAMEPAERTEFLLNEFMQNQAHEREVSRFESADNSDRARFETLAKTNPAVFKKYNAEVEHRLRLLRQNGQNAPRQTILQYLLGEAVLKNRTSAKVTERRQAASTRVSQQQTTPARNRGESGASSRPAESAARFKRLENLRI